MESKHSTPTRDETRRDEKRLWSTETEMRHEIYISCFSLSQGCGVRIESRSRFFICAGVGMGFVFFFGHSDCDFCLIAGSYTCIYHLNNSKLSKQKYGEYLDRSRVGL